MPETDWPLIAATRLHRRRMLALAVAGAWPWAAGAQAAFPSRALTMVVPFTAGGASDIGARMLNTEMGRLLGQTVVVENIGGAAGALGTQKVARAAPDGHTLLYGSLSEALLVPLINPATSYKIDDLLPVAFVGGTPAVFVVRPDFPANTLDEFIALARRSPGKFSYASPGIGSFQHVVGEAFKGRTGVFMVHIPYRGGAQILTDVMGAQVDLGITSAVNAAGFVSGGRLKAIGVTSSERLPSMPATQAYGETAALKGLEMTTWGVIYVPRGTPEPVVQRLNEAANAALMLPANVDARKRLGAVLPSPMSPAQTRAFVQAERTKYEAIVRGIKFE
jgi:tripartite-type tricarboxylate transporter receptor subunit TctC